MIEEVREAPLFRSTQAIKAKEIQMTSARLFHVSCVLPEGGALWDLLRSLEKTGCGNVEVKPVAGHVPAHVQSQLEQRQLAQPEALKQLPAPRPTKWRGGSNQGLVIAAMRPNQRVAPGEIASRTGLTLKQTHMALYNLAKAGYAARPEIGVYILVRDPRGVQR